METYALFILAVVAAGATQTRKFNPIVVGCVPGPVSSALHIAFTQTKAVEPTSVSDTARPLHHRRRT